MSKRDEIMCPVSHKLCKMCTLFRGRHYHAFSSCKEYLRRLHEEGQGRVYPDKIRKGIGGSNSV